MNIVYRSLSLEYETHVIFFQVSSSPPPPLTVLFCNGILWRCPFAVERALKTNMWRIFVNIAFRYSEEWRHKTQELRKTTVHRVTVIHYSYKRIFVARHTLCVYKYNIISYMYVCACVYKYLYAYVVENAIYFRKYPFAG